MRKFLLIGIAIILVLGISLYYFAYEDEWIDPIEPEPPEEGYHACWKCDGYTPVYKEFLESIECGTGEASDYPYTEMPDCGTEPFSGEFRTRISINYKDGTTDHAYSNREALALIHNTKEIDKITYILQARLISGPEFIEFFAIYGGYIRTEVYSYDWDDFHFRFDTSMFFFEKSVYKGAGWTDIHSEVLLIEDNIIANNLPKDLYTISIHYEPFALIEFRLDGKGDWITATRPKSTSFGINYV